MQIEKWLRGYTLKYKMPFLSSERIDVLYFLYYVYFFIL